jgi:catechol 2,3-dioxygenase-like lactoylglutathione lyase family enzyme
MIEHIHHTGFTVSSLDEALRFWVEVLGFEVVLRDELPRGEFVAEVTGAHGADLAIAMVAGPGHVIELIEYRGIRQTWSDVRPCEIGAAHVAFFVADIAAILERTEAEGWTALGRVQRVASGPWAGTQVAYIRGPDGIFIELMQPNDPPAAS